MKELVEKWLRRAKMLRDKADQCENVIDELSYFDEANMLEVCANQLKRKLKSNEEIIKTAVNVLIEPVLRLLQEDPHQWSTRPCSTCKAISSIVGKPFGCVVKAEQKEIDKSNGGG